MDTKCKHCGKEILSKAKLISDVHLKTTSVGNEPVFQEPMEFVHIECYEEMANSDELKKEVTKLKRSNTQYKNYNDKYKEEIKELKTQVKDLKHQVEEQEENAGEPDSAVEK